mgnify:CR=1 FL=1
MKEKKKLEQKMVFEILSDDRQTAFVQSYYPKSGKQDDLCRQAIKTYSAKWFTIKSSNAYVSYRSLFFNLGFQ